MRALFLALLAACGAPARRPADLAPATPRAEAARTQERVAPTTSAPLTHERRELPVHSIGEDEVVLLLATIHGDEAGGTPLLEELRRRLDSGALRAPGRRAVLVPVVNPDGRAASRRWNARGVDLNRNFPAAGFHASRRGGEEALSEPESRLVAELVRAHGPVRIVSFHEPAGCIDYDGPAADLARALADVSPLPVRRLGTRPGSLGSWTGEELGIPTLTIELPRGTGNLSPDELWARYGALVEAALVLP